MIHYVDLVSDTICAPITAHGYASVAVIRVSGDRAWSITRQFIDRGRQIRSHHVFLASFKNQREQNLDQVLITCFEKGRSFSGDETVEIACHGNPLIVNAISEVYLNSGCRLARPGEFSFRAFYNGRMNLVQAESIQQIITNNNQTASSVSLNHLEGKLSRMFEVLEEEIVRIMGHLEARIDFVEQDLDTDENPKLMALVRDTLKVTGQLLLSYESGKNIGQGHKILISGPPNVGKSSLFNRLFNEERVIVTNQAGTTRDLVGGQTFLGPHCVEFFDSAGIRNDPDPVEKMGIKKVFEAIENSRLILCVIDRLDDLKEEFFEKLPLDRCFLVFNKIDLLPFRNTVLDSTSQKPLATGKGQFSPEKNQHGWEEFFDKIISINPGFKKERIFFVSALENLHLKNLKKNIADFISFRNTNTEQNMVTQSRHFNHLLELRKSLKKTLELLEEDESPDLISQELGMGLRQVHQILGKEYNDEVLDKIFSEFCIGK